MKSTFDIVLLSRRLLIFTLALLCSIGVKFDIIELPIRPLLGIFVTALVLDVLWQFVIPDSIKKKPTIVTSHLFLDILLLGIFCAVTGGGMSPFSGLFLVPIIYAVILLPQGWAGALLCWASICYLSIALFDIPILFYDHSMDTMMDLHFFGMMVTFILTALLITTFVSRLIAINRLTKEKLTEATTLLVIEDQFTKMGVLAATTAHELNTPLSTLGLIADELQDSMTTPDQSDLIQSMNTQIARCKLAVEKGLHHYGIYTAKPLHSGDLSTLMSQLIDHWKKINPTVLLTYTSTLPPVDIMTDHYLETIIYNLLDNSAAQGTELDCSAFLKEGTLILHFKDNGPGISQAQLHHLSKPLIEQFLEYQSQNQSTRGLGLILTQFFIKRLNGTLLFLPCDRGQLIEVSLPLDTLKKS